MDVFSFITLFGGLAFFLYGMHTLSESLKKTAGGRLEKLLNKATDNKFKGLAVGAIITIAIQSSSAMTVMLVGFVNSGIMELPQTVGVIFGSDIGTTLTAWILSLAGIDSGDSLVLKLLKPSCFSLVVALIGVVMIMMCKKQRHKDIGSMLIGFAILMQGMTMMSASMEPLKEMDSFVSIMTAFKNPLLGVLSGAIVTGIIQSSAAAIGILQSISMTGQLTYGMAIPLVMGANIGTCMTAILSSIGVNRDAKRVTVIHVTIKLLGTVIWLIVFYAVNAIFDFSFMDNQVNIVGVAAIHSIFNIANTILLFPFSKLLVKIAHLIVKETEEEQEFKLDERLMLTPSIAVGECRNMMIKMVSKARDGLDKSMGMLINGYNATDFEFIKKNEERVDGYEDLLGSYLMKLTTTQHLSVEDKNKSSRILQAIGEVERIADHANYLSDSAEEIETKHLAFSDAAQEELNRVIPAVRDIYTMALDCFLSNNAANAENIGPLRIVISEMCDQFKANHVERLANGICTTEQGFVFNDILYSCVRIAEHSLNIAAIAYRFKTSGENVSDTYMHDFKQRKDKDEKKYQEYVKKYKA
ncbi:Na/Pi cotransporter family protein [Butyrivibrio sp. AE2032]|uniref:Na/Pi cotransporter family protein n=1 Tax=Butyrivibrio sp. AE2032 TaxID=1458463 RepID=UPI00054F31A4|nr:Na/Pi cotransporter family protein [Butyrivibrio sp. AE2032]